MAKVTIKALRDVREAFTRGAQQIVADCKDRCAVPFESPAPEVAALDDKLQAFLEGFAVDLADAANRVQDAVQLMIPIIKSLALAELNTEVMRGETGAAGQREEGAVGR